MSGGLLSLTLGCAAGLSFLVAVVLTWLIGRAARRIGFVDQPGGHKSHREAIPYGGGVAIFLAAWLPMAAVLAGVAWTTRTWVEATLGVTVADYVGGLRDQTATGWVVLAGGLVIHLLGLADDRRPLHATVKLLIIAAVGALVAVVGEVRIAEFAGALPSILLTIAWLIIVTNAFNFLDNMDGLSAGVACICAAFLVVCGLLAGQVLIPVAGCVFLGAIGGFLVFNFPPARIFMGDSGSLVIGYMLAVASIMTTYYESGTDASVFAVAMPLVIMAVPLYDFASVVLIRLAEGRNPMKGDQRHFSHRLVDRGLSRRAAVLTIYLATGTTCLAATLLPAATPRETITIAILVVLVLAIVAILEAPLRNNT